jgi:hypothetical protein
MLFERPYAAITFTRLKTLMPLQNTHVVLAILDPRPLAHYRRPNYFRHHSTSPQNQNHPARAAAPA